jgi:hypothetical protein
MCQQQCLLLQQQMQGDQAASKHKAFVQHLYNLLKASTVAAGVFDGTAWPMSAVFKPYSNNINAASTCTPVAVCCCSILWHGQNI